MSEPLRVAVVLTHPVQYFTPWFRYIEANRPELRVRVLYAVRPTPGAQGDGFGQPFEWDDDLLVGHDNMVLSAEPSSQRLLGNRFSHVDAPNLEDAIVRFLPDAVLVPGWHAAIYLRAMRICRRLGIPTIYRGDSTLASAPGSWARPLWRLHSRRRLHAYAAWLAVGRNSAAYLASFRVPEPLTFRSPHAVDNNLFAAGAGRLRSVESRSAWRRTHGLNPRAFVVMFAGKFISAKRPLDVVAAVGGLRDPEVEAMFVGAGELETALRAAVAAQHVKASFAGFLNQQEMPAAFAAADCLVLPSEHETWGLIVNEAMAAGLPAIVSDHVGCAPDLIVPGETGDVVPVDSPESISLAIDDLRRRQRAGHSFQRACVARAGEYTYDAATDGLVAAVSRLAKRRAARTRNAQGAPRVIGLCGGMVIPGGLERMTFEVIRVLREAGAAVHVIVNTWESTPIVNLAERVDASWSTGYYWHPISSSLMDPRVASLMLWDALRTSAGLLRDAWAFKPTTILVPEYHSALRNWPALLVLRTLGVGVLMRVGVAPAASRTHKRMWRWLIAPLVERFGCNSKFIAGELLATGVPASRVSVVYNTASRHMPEPRRVDPTRVIYVGQIIPGKGLHVLLDAVALLARQGVSVTLQVVGQVDGWESPSYAGYRGGIRARAAAPDLAGRVTFLGFRDDVAALMAEAAVHCCPSLPEIREGFANVVLEAKQAGVPSVVAPTGSLVEMVEHRVDGWVTRDATPAAIAEGLEYFLSDPRVRERASIAASRSGERFGPGQFARGWLDFFGIPAVGPAAVSSQPTGHRA